MADCFVPLRPIRIKMCIKNRHVKKVESQVGSYHLPSRQAGCRYDIGGLPKWVSLTEIILPALPQNCSFTVSSSLVFLENKRERGRWTEIHFVASSSFSSSSSTLGGLLCVCVSWTNLSKPCLAGVYVIFFSACSNELFFCFNKVKITQFCLFYF